MGLEVVELIMDIEDVFSIEISDTAFAEFHTVGDVLGYLVSRIETTDPSSVCLTSATFYALRRSAKHLGIEHRLRPSETSEAILPVSNRTAFWRNLENHSGLALPPLQRAVWVRLGITILMLASATMMGMGVYRITQSHVSAWTIGALMGCLAFMVLTKSTAKLAVYPSTDFRTIRELTESTLALNYKTMSEQYTGPTQSDIWITLRGIIAERFQIPAEQVTPSSHFIEDLGAG